MSVICSACGLNVIPKAGACPNCKQILSLGAKLPAQRKPTKEKKTWSNSSPVERVGGIVVLLMLAGVLVGGIWGLVALFSGGGDVSAPPEPARVTAPLAALEASSAPTLWVSRQDIQHLYEKNELGFTFEEAPLVDGTPRAMGKSPDGLAILDLVGPRSQLQQATIVVVFPSDYPDVLMLNAVYMMGLLNNVLPNWSGGADWLTESIEVAELLGEVETTHGNARITLSYLEEMAMWILSIERK